MLKLVHFDPNANVTEMNKQTTALFQVHVDPSLAAFGRLGVGVEEIQVQNKLRPPRACTKFLDERIQNRPFLREPFGKLGILMERFMNMKLVELARGEVATVVFAGEGSDLIVSCHMVAEVMLETRRVRAEGTNETVTAVFLGIVGVQRRRLLVSHFAFVALVLPVFKMLCAVRFEHIATGAAVITNVALEPIVLVVVELVSIELSFVGVGLAAIREVATIRFSKRKWSGKLGKERKAGGKEKVSIDRRMDVEFRMPRSHPRFIVRRPFALRLFLRRSTVVLVLFVTVIVVPFLDRKEQNPCQLAIDHRIDSNEVPSRRPTLTAFATPTAATPMKKALATTVAAAEMEREAIECSDSAAGAAATKVEKRTK